MPVELKKLVESLSCVSNDVNMYLDTVTGEAIPLSDDWQSEFGDGTSDDEPQWMKDARAEAELITANVDNRFVKLPDSFEIHEWSIMEKFCRSIKSPKLFDEFDRAIHGSKAFHKFRDCLRRHDLEQKWYDYRDSALLEIAIEWCKENNVQYVK